MGDAVQSEGHAGVPAPAVGLQPTGEIGPRFGGVANRRDGDHRADRRDADHRTDPRRHAEIDGGPGLDAAAMLARLVEAEILPRLMLAHRPARPAAPARRPDADEVARFCALLLGPGPIDVDARVAALLAEGLPLPSLLLDLLAPAARHLGALWEEDACDFLAVTEALGRLQAISRRLCADLEDEAVPPAGRSVLLAPCPGETHLYGLQVVASFFREAGWDVTDACLGPHRDLLDLVRAGWFDAVGLSLSCDVRLPALVEAVSAVRRASRNRDLRVIVGGPYFGRHATAAEAIGADACVSDGRSAPALAEALLDRRAMAC